MNLVFKALADPSRRELLDRLYATDGLTLRKLCIGLAMTRQAVTKHLLLLEDAGLVTTTWQGREKLHRLNPAPLKQISARWINKYELQPTIARARLDATTAPDADGESRWTNLHST